MSRQQFCEELAKKGLCFGWYNGEFVTVQSYLEGKLGRQVDNGEVWGYIKKVTAKK